MEEFTITPPQVFSALRHVEAQRGWQGTFKRPGAAAFEGDLALKTAAERQVIPSPRSFSKP